MTLFKVRVLWCEQSHAITSMLAVLLKIAKKICVVRVRVQVNYAITTAA